MTALVARQPLHPLPMSSTQRPAKRLSARLQEKDAEQNTHAFNPGQPAQVWKNAPNVDVQATQNGKKRKNSELHQLYALLIMS